jgi:hypothetical protein
VLLGPVERCARSFVARHLRHPFVRVTFAAAKVTGPPSPFALRRRAIRQTVVPAGSGPVTGAGDGRRWSYL